MLIFYIDRTFGTTFKSTQKSVKKSIVNIEVLLSLLTDTGEDSKLVNRRKRPKLDASFYPLFFPTRPSDEYDSAPSRKNSRPLLDIFACID